MPILFRSLVADAGLDPRSVRVLRHTEHADLLQVWRRNRVVFERYQSVQLKSARSYFARPLWAAFLALRDGRTCFVGMYEAQLLGAVDDGDIDPLTGHPLHSDIHERYACALTGHMQEFSERLFIDWSGRNWRQNGEGAHTVTQIAAVPEEPDFPGALTFIRPLSDIAYLPESWLSHLGQLKGVYLLTCPRTREQYVGKADGEGGFLSRWLSYVADGHGGNVRLKSREPSDYQVSILEVAGSSADPGVISAMEQRWKLKLQTREMGLNAN